MSDIKPKVKEIRKELEHLRRQHEELMLITSNAIESYGLIVSPRLKELAESPELPAEHIDTLLIVVKATKELIKAMVMDKSTKTDLEDLMTYKGVR